MHFVVVFLIMNHQYMVKNHLKIADLSLQNSSIKITAVITYLTNELANFKEQSPS